MKMLGKTRGASACGYGCCVNDTKIKSKRRLRRIETRAWKKEFSL